MIQLDAFASANAGFSVGGNDADCGGFDTQIERISPRNPDYPGLLREQGDPCDDELDVKWIPPAPIHEQHFLEHNLRIVRLNATCPLYEELLCLRGEVLGVEPAKCANPVDGYSNLYMMYQEQRAISALRVTFASQGAVDCEEFYPAPLMERYRDKLASASGFVALQGLDPSLRVARLLVEAAWIDGLPHGVRIDVINAAERGVRYYQRLGYALIEDSFFIHPRLGTKSYAMLFTADPKRETPLSHLFEHLDDPISEAEVASIVPLSQAESRFGRPRRRRAAPAMA